MCEIPVLTFTGFSGTGKTTFLEGLIPCLMKRGLTVAVVKHDAHGFQPDQEGKDTSRFAKAGAAMTMLSGDGVTVTVEYRPRPLSELLEGIRHVDIILTEGYHQEGFPLVSMCREATGRGWRIPPANAIAAVSDGMPVTEVPWFSLTDLDGFADFVVEYVRDKNRLKKGGGEHGF